jgi:hypothetical protein
VGFGSEGVVASHPFHTGVAKPLGPPARQSYSAGVGFRQGIPSGNLRDAVWEVPDAACKITCQSYPCTALSIDMLFTNTELQVPVPCRR